MSRTLSVVATGAVLDQQRTALFLPVLKIVHGTTEFYVVDGRETVTYDGNDYLPYPFSISLPMESEDRPPQVTLSIDNVDRLLEELIRSITTPPTVILSYLLNGTPPTLEVGPISFIMRTAERNAATITMRLTFAAVLDEPFPSSVMTPGTYPGIFGGVPEGTDWEPLADRAAEGALPSFGEPAKTGYGKRRRRRGN